MPRKSDEPFASSQAVRARMQTLPRRNTAPEVALRRASHALGLRYWIHRRPLATLRREADMVFSRVRVAVFVDGCFWHGCPDHGRRIYKTNDWYWPDKIQTNTARDRDTDQALCAAGWAVVRVWEHEDPYLAAERIRELVSGRAGRAPRS
jgi:DNA mismatch endonuclease (patch repair protein)